MIVDHIEKKYVGMKYNAITFNCWTLIKEIYTELHYTLKEFDFTGYNPDWAKFGYEYFTKSEAAHEWTRTSEPIMFDVVLFRNCKGIAFHAGVMLDDNRFIHCTGAGVRINRLSESMWQKRFYGFYRLKARAAW